MFNVSTIAAVIALLFSISATFNAYVLRGGKLAWSQVLTALGAVALMFSLVLPQSFLIVYLTNVNFLGAGPSDILYILGFLLLLVGSLRLRSSLT